ncbi:hypothetical protein I204_03171 [Kwoniella mangroviensis CBS 8886]|uniref:uncharacterized protein n=1 Tax=Kwoniella mangroviensis CBS 8507 TaxID=1296122 RepID=UPI00080CFC2D|nr:uncharacterized protein I203_00228 [Kwoniella mangroviensis CBS 8507]OCF70097.1 hypothetical protein I203_00228 [Kwoniella mangroviensis CBS 8507]OCF75875.1 hypothetical protein I204_03171 [Kwoniella mangroviensis CBS 8886]
MSLSCRVMGEWRYGNCGCTELVHSLPQDTKALKDARKYLGSFTCGTGANFPLSRVTLYSPSTDELTSTLRTLVLDESQRAVDVRNYDDMEKDENRDIGISDDILGGIESQDPTINIASDKANDITLYEVASHVLPIYGHSDCSAVTGRYDPCGCHLITTVAQEAPRSSRDDKPTRFWKKAVLLGIDPTCPMKNNGLSRMTSLELDMRIS